MNFSGNAHLRERNVVAGCGALRRAFLHAAVRRFCIPGGALLTAGLIAVGCAPPRPPQPLIGTYEADIPVSGSGGSRVSLQIHADSTYRLLIQELDRIGRLSGEYQDDAGRWTVDPGGLIRLASGLSGVRFFRRVRSGSLSVLPDSAAAAPDAPILVRISDDTRTPVAPPSRPLFGWYSYMADAGRFGECPDRRSVLVAMEGDNAALERAYGTVRREPGEKVLVYVEGYYRMQYDMEGQNVVRVLVPVKFVRVEGRGGCPG